MFEGYVNYHDPLEKYEDLNELAAILAMNSPDPNRYHIEALNGPYKKVLIQCSDGYQGEFSLDGYGKLLTIKKVFKARYGTINLEE